MLTTWSGLSGPAVESHDPGAGLNGDGVRPAPRPVPDARGKGVIELAREMAVSFAEHMGE